MRRQRLSAENVWKNFLDALKNRELRMLVLMIFVLEAGFQFGIAIGFHVNTYTYGLTGPRIGALGLLVLGTSVLSQPLWVAFMKRFEKRTALIVGIAIGFVGFIGAPWTHVWWRLFPIHAPTFPFTLGIFMVLAGLGNGAFMSIPKSMTATPRTSKSLPRESGTRGSISALTRSPIKRAPPSPGRSREWRSL